MPTKYTINKGDTLKLVFGITGYGPLDPVNVKICAYSENNTAITHVGDPSWKSDMYMITPYAGAPKDRFTIKDPRDTNSILLWSDHDSGLGMLMLRPVTDGDKRLILIATYSPDGKNWYTTSRELSYHVNSWTEKNQNVLVILTLIFTIVSVPSVNQLFQYCNQRRRLRKKRNRVKKQQTQKGT